MRLTDVGRDGEPLTTWQIEDRLATALGARSDFKIEIRWEGPSGEHAVSISALGMLGLGRHRSLDQAVRIAFQRLEDML